MNNHQSQEQEPFELWQRERPVERWQREQWERRVEQLQRKQFERWQREVVEHQLQEPGRFERWEREAMGSLVIDTVSMLWSAFKVEHSQDLMNDDPALLSLSFKDMRPRGEPLGVDYLSLLSDMRPREKPYDADYLLDMLPRGKPDDADSDSFFVIRHDEGRVGKTEDRKPSGEDAREALPSEFERLKIESLEKKLRKKQQEQEIRQQGEEEEEFLKWKTRSSDTLTGNDEIETSRRQLRRYKPYSVNVDCGTKLMRRYSKL